MKKIKSIKFYSNGYSKADEFAKNVERIIKEKNINVKIVKNGEADLIVSLGGDGTVIDTARKSGFNPRSKYLAVNFGSKGFLTNVTKEEALSIILDILQKPDTYETEKIKVLDIDIYYTDGRKRKEYAFNEIWFKGYDDASIEFKQYSSEGFLQRFTATGLIVATPLGSTAVAMSAGGGVIINGNVMVSAINLSSEVGTEDRFFKNSIIDTGMTIKFITKEEIIAEQIKKGNIVDGKPIYDHSRYEMNIKIDNAIIEKCYPEKIDRVDINLDNRLEFVKVTSKTRTQKMRECILKINEN